MYADATLTPKESIRLAALGTLAEQPMRYGDLANAIRFFVSRVVGPTPEIMGHSLELLRYEGLVETREGSGDLALLALTPEGRREMLSLLSANLRPGNSELNTLIMALKFRFLHALAPDERGRQLEMMIGAGERELSRLQDLREHHGSGGGLLPAWIDQQIAAAEARLAWLEGLADAPAAVDGAPD